MRRTALVAGVLYLVTFASSIPAVLLLDPVLSNPTYVLGEGPEGQVRVGAVLDLINAFACIGTAVALFSVIRREHEAFAVGFVTTRMFEAAVIVVGVVCVLTVVTLRQPATLAEGAARVSIAHSLVVARNWTFIIGPSLMPAFNAVMLGYPLYRTRLVPRPSRRSDSSVHRSLPRRRWRRSSASTRRPPGSPRSRRCRSLYGSCSSDSG